MSKFSPCCTCLLVTTEEAEDQPLSGWRDEMQPLVRRQSRPDDIFHDSDYAQLSASLHGLDTISEGIFLPRASLKTIARTAKIYIFRILTPKL